MVLYRTSCPLRQFATDHTSGRLFWYMGAPRFLERPLYQSNRVIAQQSVANWQRPRGSAKMHERQRVNLAAPLLASFISNLNFRISRNPILK